MPLERRLQREATHVGTYRETVPCRAEETVLANECSAGRALVDGESVR